MIVQPVTKYIKLVLLSATQTIKCHAIKTWAVFVISQDHKLIACSITLIRNFVTLKIEYHATIMPLDGIWQMIKKLWLPPLILQFKIQTQDTVTQMMDFLATQIMVSDAILLIIIIFAQQVTKFIFNLFLIAFQMTEFLAIKIKDKFATLQSIWTLIGAIHWILHKVVQLWMESHVSVFSKDYM